MELFIDFEGFLTENDDFIIKELAAISLTGGSDTAVLKIFKPPAEYSQGKISETNDFWRNTHGIRWEEGSTSYETLEEVLMEMVKNKAYVYVLGEREKQWLDKITGYQTKIINLMKMPYIEQLYSFEDPDELCLFKEKHPRTSGYACAFETVRRLKNWFVGCWGEKPSIDKSLQLQTLTKMHPQDIACLDETFILMLAKNDISKVWAMLPPRMQNDLRFRGFSRCTEHYITGGDDFDGPNPLKKDCIRCNSIS